MSLYNSIIITWSLFYLSNSFSYPLPWDERPLVRSINDTGEEGETGGPQGPGRQGRWGVGDRA